MKARDYIKIMQKILHNIDEGVHVIDSTGKTIIYNSAMAKLEGMKPKDVINKPFLDIFKSLNSETSTLLHVLESGESLIDKKQSYLNKDGQEITTINTTIPLEIENQIFGAIEIAKNITKIKELSDTILTLHRKISSPTKTIEKTKRKYTFENIIGDNIDFKKAVQIAEKASRSSASVLIYGKTGTGKELIAQSIHYASDRADKSFIAQNCAAIPGTLLEGILFGTSKGGFTGAIDRSGLFEQSSGGTILLDEINSMPIDLQAKILRVLQEGYVRRVGGDKDIPIDIRIIATTNENPIEAVKEGKIRKDLYYRLNVIPINLPSLQKRKNDIIILAKYFIKKYNEKLKKDIWMISDSLKHKMLTYNWPGNVRELENLIQGAMSIIDDDEHVLSELNFVSFDSNESDLDINVTIDDDFNLDTVMESLEKKFIKESLDYNNYNISRSAAVLGIKRQTLQHKIKKYEIKKEAK